MNDKSNPLGRGTHSSASDGEELQELIRNRIESLRPKLLDLSRRNPLISTKFSPRSNSHIRVVDELPDVLFFHLSGRQAMRFLPLPRLEDDPRDEQTTEFQDALANARLTDEDYLAAVDQIDPYSEEALEQNQQLERALRDRVRELLGMPPRQTSTDVSLAQHARNNQISPSYELPDPTNEHEDGRHTDDDIQTLLLPNDLERKLNGLTAKCRTWVQETGINVLHAAFGFLEWVEPNGQERSLSPLVLVPVEIEKRKTREGPEYWVYGTGDEVETNLVLVEKLRLDFGIDLPRYEGASIEEYLAEVADASPKSLKWKVRRQVAFGVFPSARMVMYYDLDSSRNSFDRHNVITSLLGGSSASGSVLFADEYEIDQPEIEAKVPCLVLDADCSQFSAIADIADGRNLAVEGPPGTGKSQTIVNTIAAAIAGGKKVLFVAEKSAALNVVKSRLEAVGLGEFILPLQAERSSREKVIQSVRDRMEMEVASTPRDYDRKIKEFRHTRSELAAYIDVMSAQFGQTGLTVHDVLGKSIMTNDVLADKPKALVNPEINNISTFDQSRIDALRELGTAVEKAWREANGAKSYWRGHGLPHIDRFAVERICELAESAADAYRNAAEARRALADFAVDPDTDLPDLRSLQAVLDKLPPSNSIDVDLIVRICREDQSETLSQFFDGCRRFQAGKEDLSSLLKDPTDESWPDLLRKIITLTEEGEFDNLDVETHRSKLAEQASLLSKRKKAYEKLEQFTELLPGNRSFSIPGLRKARKLICGTPREILVLRNEITAAPAAAAVMAQAGRQARALQEKREKLTKILSIPSDISIADLSAYVATILSASPFNLFSSNYRSAKRAYRAISRRRSFKRKIAVRDLQLLVDWKEAEQALLNNQQFSTVFGIHFQGVDTDFESFGHLCIYYEAVERELPGAENREIRKFLKTGDLDLLMSIPEFDEGVGDQTLEELGKEIDRVQNYLRKAEDALEKLNSLVPGFKEPAEIQVGSLNSLLEQVNTQFKLKAVLDRDQSVSGLLGDRFNGASTDWASFASDMEAARTVRSSEVDFLVVLGILEKNVIEAALTAIEQVIQKGQEAQASLSVLSEQIGKDVADFSEGRTYSKIAEYLRAAARDKDGLFIHSAYAAARRDLDRAGFDWVVTILLDEQSPLDNLGAILEAVIIRALAIEVYRIHGPALGRFRGERLNELRARLAALDRQIIELSRDHLRTKAHRAANPPRGNGVGRKSTWTEMALIEHEIRLKRPRTRIRDLTRRAGRALLEIKPCWMMSPLAVAQYLPRGDPHFDLCIIDEASQMPPEDSIGALVRSRQAMVVGDTNQLPPTSFFRRMIDDEDVDEDEAVLNESVLEMANAAFRPARRLRWHYRSRHSALIRFSNHLVYDDNLIVFPSAFESRPDMGVSLISVPGRYRSGINGEEARTVINAALSFMRTSPDRSLGIVTMNQKQRDLLQEEWDYSLSRDAAASKYVEEWTEKNDGLESFFIKNLENVQGDERDVMFISTVYGPEEPGGPVMQRFGPINGVAGKRRLNVLFSRAKKQIVTFSSMTAADIRADENGNPGAYMLKRWLEYSETGVLHAGEQTHRAPESDFEIFVIDQMRSMGCEPIPQVGVAGYFIDIGVRHPEWPHGFIMGVECDGAAYHSSKSARDRDRLRQEVLEGLGWRLYRIWSTDWFNDPRKETEKLRNAIEARLDDLKKNSISIVSQLVDEPPIYVSPQTDECVDEVGPGKEQSTGATDHTGSISVTDTLMPESRLEETDLSGISVGDTVRVRYTSGTKSTLQVTLSDEINAPERSIVHISEPLGQALLRAEEGDEIEVLVGSYVREAVIEQVTKGDRSERARETDNDHDDPDVNEETAPISRTGSPEENRSSQPGMREAQRPYPVDRPCTSNDGKTVSVQTTLFDRPSQPCSPSANVDLRPDQFYEPKYAGTIRTLGTEMIDTIGPITFRHLSEKIARAHGFQRTGSQIKKQVWVALSKVRKVTKAPNGESIFWPHGSEPKVAIPFRGMRVEGAERTWRDVPYPEKLGLAQSVRTKRKTKGEAISGMASHIELGRLRHSTRQELEELLKAAEQLTEDE